MKGNAVAGLLVVVVGVALMLYGDSVSRQAFYDATPRDYILAMGTLAPAGAFTGGLIFAAGLFVMFAGVMIAFIPTKKRAISVE